MPPGASNSQDYINTATESSVTVEVTLPPESLSTDDVKVTLSDGAGKNVQDNANGVTGGGVVTIQVNATSLHDGQINVSVDTNNGQAQSQFLGAFVKDTTPPELPSAVTALNAQGEAWAYVNIATSPAAVMRASFSAAPLEGGSAQLFVRVGAQEVSSSVQPFSTASFTFEALDLTTLPDGQLDLDLVVMDLALNTTTGTFHTTKDTVAPQAPYSAVIAAGLANPVNTINATSASLVAASMIFGPDAEVRNVHAVITDGVNTVTSDPTTVPLSGGPVAVGAMNASGFADGPISVTAIVVDLAGNETPFYGSPAIKDTIGPGGASAASVAGGPSNAPSVVNLASVLAVHVDVTFPSGGSATDTATVVLGFGGGSVSSTPFPVPPGGGSVSIFGLNCTGLGDGLVSVTVNVSDVGGNVTPFNGTPALKDTIPPPAPTVARVAGTAVNNPDFINIASAGSVAGLVVFPPATSGTETYTYTLSDASITLSSAPFTPPVGGGSISVPPMNCTGMSDGFVTVSVTATDAVGNTTAMTGTSALKDTVAPIPATAASVNAGPGNGAGIINIASAPAVSVSVTWPASAPGTESAVVTLSNGGTASGSVVQVAGGGVTNASSINAAAVTDGTVAVTVTTTDPAGNVATFTGTPATKDTVGPVAPIAAGVAAGVGNSANVINASNVGNVTVSVTWPATSPGTETAQVTLGGTITVPVAQSAGAGVTTVSGIDASSLADGPVSVTVALTDSVGNAASFIGATASKSAVGPISATLVDIPASGPNPPNWVNAANANSVTVRVVFPPAASGTETVTLACTDGSTTVNAGPQPVPAGGGTVNFAGLNLGTLSDGPLTLTATTTAGLNVTNTPSSGVAKDTVVPANPTAANVAAGVSNPIDVINAITVNAANVSVSWPGDVGNETMFVSISDGVSSQASVPQTLAAGPATVAFGSIDCTPLADGPVTVTVFVIDTAGNPTVFGGTPANKDTVSPSAPTSAQVVPSATGNPVNVINGASAGSTDVSVAFASGNPSDSAAVTLSDGVIGVSSGLQAVAPGGSVTFTMNASGLSDGPISVAVNLFDPAGNVTVFSGTPATKDTVAPPLLVDPTTTPTSAASQTITGETGASTSVLILGGAAPATGTSAANGRFAMPVSLNPGVTNTLTVSATDGSGNTSTVTQDFVAGTLTIVQSPTAPPVVFTDVTAASGLSYPLGAAGGSFQDLDNDGDLDLFVGLTNKVWQNNGAGVFTDVTANTLVPFAGGTSATFGDYDNDGYLDLLLVNGSAVQLMHNDFGTTSMIKFTDATASSLATASGTLRAGFWADYDQDGYVDFVVTDSAPAGPVVRRNLGTSTFAPLSLFAPTGAQMLFGVAADIVADNRADFIFADASPSYFYRNDGSSTFTDIAGLTSNVSIAQTVAEAGGVIVADYDNDGDLDIIVAAGGALSPSASCGGCPRPNNQLFQNNGTSSFTAQIGGQNLAFLAGIEPSDGWEDLCAGDLNNDGRMDLIANSKNATRVFLNVGDVTGPDGVWEFVEVAAACGIVSLSNDGQYMIQAADIDGDGDLDLFIPTTSGFNSVYRNDVNNRRNLTVLVHGLGTGAGTASKDGIGAHVELRDSTGTTILATSEINGGRGLGSQDPLRAHFGVTPSQVYTVQVTFASGAVRTANNVVPRDVPNQTITVNE